ncbi:glycosyltransferase involved in cell wall biosynthesis [Thermosporothrix hazakensis]|jgi:glycosyltransferase involved in cell wall biosynthesis|uniref:Glycosyltransferase involved in cell wall biosynthesis n=1 Tax=Thermosporothrix hazakensis TaxID=644383 RepID=A0A326UBF4_THEHA|nr:glycosyltransferase [Thermosporothrix hazakensis]PZW33018.1 glycosyltransferase involved in cell wall biosynthesis [Thermosporothrix hazakensis]GCE49049.1 glycosyl transferase [Thermosporothrix hazakensis]
MKVALVHDYLNQMGGAERVVLALHEIFPDAPLYTSIYDPDRVDPAFRKMDIRTSFMQKLPWVTKHHQPYLPLYPFAMEKLDLRGYDLVLSSSSAFGKGVITRPETMHICYCHTPMRWCWNYDEYIEREQLGKVARGVLPFLITGLRMWDQTSAMRVDHFIANSPTIAERIRKYYRRESVVIPPPVEASRFPFDPQTQPESYFLVVSRLAPYKRIDLAIEACNRLRLPLIIIGGGRDEERLRRLAGPTIHFLGRLPDSEVIHYFRHCRALLFPGEEDFGITPLEAQAAGRPVIAYGAGGALASIVEGVTGLFFREQTVESLVEVLEQFDERQFQPEAIRNHALEFDTPRFQRRVQQFIEAKIQAAKSGESSRSSSDVL